MKDKLFNLFESAGELTLNVICANIIMAALLGFLICISYYISHRGTIYSKKFNASLKNDGILFVGSTEQIISPGESGFSTYKSFFYKKAAHQWAAFNLAQL